MAARWYLRYGLLYRDVEELLAERVTAVVVKPDTARNRRWSGDDQPCASACRVIARHAPRAGRVKSSRVEACG